MLISKLFVPLYAQLFVMKTLQPVILTFVLFCIALTMQAQYVIVSGGGSIGSSQTRQQQTVGEHSSFFVNGYIYGTDDMEEKPYALPNANVQIVCLNDTSVSSVAVSDKKGHFQTRRFSRHQKFHLPLLPKMLF